MPYDCTCSKKDCMPCAAIMGKCEQGCDCGYCMYGENVPKAYVPTNPCELCMIRMIWEEEKEERYQAGECDCEEVCDDDGPYVKWLCNFCLRREEEEKKEAAAAKESKTN